MKKGRKYQVVGGDDGGDPETGSGVSKRIAVWDTPTTLTSYAGLEVVDDAGADHVVLTFPGVLRWNLVNADPTVQSGDLALDSNNRLAYQITRQESIDPTEGAWSLAFTYDVPFFYAFPVAENSFVTTTTVNAVASQATLSSPNDDGLYMLDTIVNAGVSGTGTFSALTAARVIKQHSLFRRSGGVLTKAGSTIETVNTGDASLAAITADYDVNAGAIRRTFTGIAATTIGWKVAYNLYRLTGAF